MTTNLPTKANGQLPDAFKGGQRAKAFANETMERASEGITGGYGVLRYGGKVWSLSYKGQDYPFMRPDGDGTRGNLELVVVRMPLSKSKTFFPGGYKPGSHEKPACWSSDAIKPDATVPPATRQHDNCTLCPQNKVGSRVNEATGKASRACGDHKQIAVVLDPSMLAGITGLQVLEPVMLRIPGASLSDFAAYGDRMEAQNYPLPTILTRVGFDPKEKYPKFVWTEVRPLTDEEGDVALAMRNDPVALRITGEVAPQAAIPFEEAKAAPVQTAATTSTITETAATPTAPVSAAASPSNVVELKPAPVPSVEAPEDIDAKIKALLGD